MEFLLQSGLFFVKTLIVAIVIIIAIAAILFIIVGILALSRKMKARIEISPFYEHYQDAKGQLLKLAKNKKLPKEKNKANKSKPALYVLDFNGDVKASQVEQLREMITLVLSVADKKDEIVVRVDSPGGTVNGYGLAAAQLQRIRAHEIPLTVCIDKVAASGGYLMASVANQIVAAPFAIVGSIGVVAQLPNFHRWLKKNDIDVELLTAGEYKRTLTLFAKNTDKGREKFQEELEEVHESFRNYVLVNRPGLDIHKVATGEHWLARDAFNLNLVDQLQTSDEYLANKTQNFNILKISMPEKMSLATKLFKPVMDFYFRSSYFT